MNNWPLQDKAIHDAYRLIARHVYRGRGVFAYQAFDDINARYFAGAIPEPLILWDITQHGHALGWCRPSQDGPPIIKLHPSILSGTESATPWGLTPYVLGVCYAYDVLLHECMHEAVERLRGGWRHLPEVTKLWTSHNNPVWVAECNRIAGLLGYAATITMNGSARVAVPGETTKTGKQRTVTKWTDPGGIPASRFPHTLPGRRTFYLHNALPFKLELDGLRLAGAAARAACDVQLYMTGGCQDLAPTSADRAAGRLRACKG